MVIEVPDSDKDSDEEKVDNLEYHKDALFKHINQRKNELRRYIDVHHQVQHKIAMLGGDVGQPSHERHPEMFYRFCSHDSYQVHLDKKVRTAYFGTEKGLIY